jgi:hypothetical protein
MGILTATVAAVAGMMGGIVVVIVRPFSKGATAILRTLIIAGGAFLASWRFNINPLPILVTTTLVSLLWGVLFKDPKKAAE